ncbi:heme-degrading domain-containing protein [Aeromicrobium sp.]|uniref:heme-degrading domain-containing protein n=1 Tax=Aeromicrobium sp. TaxID=1871063 RepID=UPI0019B6A777|nr:heme-degrading domain-containing protein [Aeromicrobium sp.]MBC7632609.1 heme-degrading domain-containing protein [Aeromicrobium sp.]
MTDPRHPNEAPDRELLDALTAQEERLVFTRFDEQTAWEVGVALREAALKAGLPVAISVRRNGQRLFHVALPGASADNDSWLDRKCAVVDRYGHSSLLIGERFRVAGRSFDVDARLDNEHFAAHGGAFPVLVSGTGCIGTVAVSGLPQLDDHRLVVEVLETFLAQSTELGRTGKPAAR